MPAGEFERKGIWTLTIADADYPRPFVDRLGPNAPPVIFGAGDQSLLSGEGPGNAALERLGAVPIRPSQKLAHLLNAKPVEAPTPAEDPVQLGFLDGEEPTETIKERGVGSSQIPNADRPSILRRTAAARPSRCTPSWLRIQRRSPRSHLKNLRDPRNDNPTMARSERRPLIGSSGSKGSLDRLVEPRRW